VVPDLCGCAQPYDASPQKPHAGDARGAAFIASVGLGEIVFDNTPDLTEYEDIFEPEPTNRRVYDRFFSEFVKIYRNKRSYTTC